MTAKLSRRALAKLLGAASASLSFPTAFSAAESAPPAPAAAPASPAETDRLFPADFLWGSATASYQVEGAVHEGGRGPTIWDTFSHTPGKTTHGDTGDVSTDSYHRFHEDIALMKDLGLKTCRFSVAWSRIFPTGIGAPNPVGLDYYKRFTDALLEAGIEPYCTLYHWDLPQPLQDRGGWQNHDTPKLYADYAGYFAGQMSDKIHHFMTMNEMRTFVEQGNQTGKHAPGFHLNQKQLAQLAHHAVLGHGMGVQAIRAAAKPGTRVGIADNPLPICPLIESPEGIAAARIGMREENAQYLTVMMEGRYTDLYLKRLGADAPHFTAEELKIIASPMDFVGLNIYQPEYVRPDASNAGYAVVDTPASFPRMQSEWLYVGPEGLYWAPKLAYDLWKIRDLYITENGCPSSDTVAPDGQIYDSDRIMFLRNYLTQLLRAVSEGVPVKGYFLWSLLDNFEWNDGYARRFGITYVDFKTQKRTPKMSSTFYKQVITSRRVS